MSKNRVADYGYIREAFMVRRYHTVGHVHMEERVGYHTANVMAILFFLFDDHPPLYLLRHALHHDVPELATGDLPATTKWRHPELAKAVEKVEEELIEAMQLENHPLEPLHRDLLKFADMMDLCFKSVEEMSVGNEAFQKILFNGLVYIHGLLEGSLRSWPQAHIMLHLLKCNKFINIEEVYNGEPLDAGTKH